MVHFIFIFFHLRFIDHEVLVDFLCQWRHLTTASLTTRHQASEIQRPPSYILIDPSGYFCSVWSKSLRNLLLFRSLLFPKVFILQFRNFFTDSMPLVIDSLLSIFIVRKRLFVIMKLCDLKKKIYCLLWKHFWPKFRKTWIRIWISFIFFFVLDPDSQCKKTVSESAYRKTNENPT